MNARRLVPQSGTTLYSQLAGVLRGRILRGDWPVGHELPTLEALCEQYGVARISARQAIQLLSAEGLVSSGRGRRTVVTAAGLSARPLFPGLAEPLQQAPHYSVAVLDKDLATKLPDALAEHGEPERAYVRIRKVDSEAGEPYSVSNIWVASAVYRRFPPDAELNAKLSRLVRSVIKDPFMSAQETITVASADVDEARALGCALSAPVARVQRVFLDARGHVLYAGWSVYRGDRFVLRRELTELEQVDARRAESGSVLHRLSTTSAGRAPSRR